jgi:hypothetical protein
LLVANQVMCAQGYNLYLELQNVSVCEEIA